MKGLAGAAVIASVLLSGALAQAADIPLKAVRPIVPEAFSWTGFYIGANVGAVHGRSSADTVNGPLFPPFAVVPPTAPIFTLIPGQLATLSGGSNNTAVIGGGQIGYNWQINQFVLGVEADGSGTGLRGFSASNARTFGPPILPSRSPRR